MIKTQSNLSDAIIDRASAEVGLLWPLDRAVAVNPLLDMIEQSFPDATATLGARLGIDPWPTQQHLDEIMQREMMLAKNDITRQEVAKRPPTMIARSDDSGEREISAARMMVGQVLLEAVTAENASRVPFLERACRVLASGSSWVRAPRGVRNATLRILGEENLNDLVASLCGWSEAEVEEEFARHFARLPGWSAWAKWGDLWSRTPHQAAVTRRELLTLSIAVDLAWLERVGAPSPLAPALLQHLGAQPGLARLELIEDVVHGEILDLLHPREAVKVTNPRFQVVACIDVRSEPLRRALESDPDTETFGFAGFFGVSATVQRAGDREAYESLPVLVAPAVSILGGPSPTTRNDEVVAAGGTLAELTHEPAAMFALAETSGFLGAPWLLARSFSPRSRWPLSESPGEWSLQADDVVEMAEGSLRGMGLTGTFAPEVLLLGHTSTTTNNAHFATLQCGACAGHAGGPNAAALVGVLNDPGVRDALRTRGIDIPISTRFLSGEHDTTREIVNVRDQCSDELLALLKAGSDVVAQWRAGEQVSDVASARRVLDRRARDWSEVRPEWGLANHAAFVIAPRSSLRGVDLAGRSFLHSYDPDSDDTGSILSFILSAPVVVAQWINAAYYFSSVSPDVLGAGDKTLLNPIGDFAVIQGEDPDLRLGLPWQSVATGERPVHLPVRLLVAVEAPLDRITASVHSAAMPQQLIEGGWVRLVGRSGPLDDWHHWVPGQGWATSDAQ